MLIWPVDQRYCECPRPSPPGRTGSRVGGNEVLIGARRALSVAVRAGSARAPPLVASRRDRRHRQRDLAAWERSGAQTPCFARAGSDACVCSATRGLSSSPALPPPVSNPGAQPAGHVGRGRVQEAQLRLRRRCGSVIGVHPRSPPSPNPILNPNPNANSNPKPNPKPNPNPKQTGNSPPRRRRRRPARRASGCSPTASAGRGGAHSAHPEPIAHPNPRPPPP